METLQTVLDFATIAPFIVAAGMFLDYTWKRTTPHTVKVAAVPDPCQPVEDSQVQTANELHIPDPEVGTAIALADDLIQGCDVADLLEIAPTVAPVEADDRSLVALAKLHGLPQAKKWSYSRKLRTSEREAVLGLAAS